MNANAAEIKAHTMIAARSTAQLLNDWDLTENKADTDGITIELATVRGWLIDELKRRNYSAWDAWMDDEDPDASPRKYFA